jgi:hypothetical protein
VIFFRFVIVVVNVDAELDLFYGDGLLVLFRFALFFLLLVEKFPIVHDAADRRLRGGGNFDQIQILTAGQLQRFVGRQDADLSTFIVDYADFAGSNAVVNSDKTFIDTVLRALGRLMRIRNYSMWGWRITSASVWRKRNLSVLAVWYPPSHKTRGQGTHFDLASAVKGWAIRLLLPGV